MGQFDVPGEWPCKTCAGQGLLITEPTEPPIVYVTAAELARLRAAAGGAADKPTLTEPERERSGQTQVKGRASRLSSGSVSAAADKPTLDEIADRIVTDYGETLRKLGDELSAAADRPESEPDPWETIVTTESGERGEWWEDAWRKA